MTNPHQPVEDLRTAFRMLQQRWEATRAVWHDLVRWRFERAYWEPLERQAHVTHEEAARLAEVLAKAMRHAP